MYPTFFETICQSVGFIGLFIVGAATLFGIIGTIVSIWDTNSKVCKLHKKLCAPKKKRKK